MGFDYKYVENKIADQISSGEYVSGARIPSERELCEIYSVSRTTIRKAIDELVINNYLVKHPGKGTYVALDLSGKKKMTGNILFLRCIHSDIHEPPYSMNDDIFYPKVLIGIEMGTAKRDYHCLVKTINENNPDPDVINQVAHKVDGIICGELHNHSFLNRLLDLNLPIVLVSPSVSSNQVDIVDIDNVNGAYKAARTLIELGHKRIGFIGGSSVSLPSKNRQQGYLTALTEAGISADDSMILSSGWCFEDGYNAMNKLLELVKKPTAVLTASDLLGIGALNAIKDSGLRVPEDISLIGFDGIDMARQIKPSLTTMQVRKVAIGRTAANLIFERLENIRDYPVKVSIPTVLIKGDSIAVL